MDRDSLFRDIPDDGTYSGPCKITFSDPVGSIEGAGTVRILADRRADIEMTVEGFEAPPEYGDGPLSLPAFLNGSPPKREEGGRAVVSISAPSAERFIASLSVETKSGTFTAASGLLAPSVFLGIGGDAKVFIATNDLAFKPCADVAGSYWLLPLQGPFGGYYLPRQPRPHVLALGNEGYLQFTADGLTCGLQIFGPGKSPDHPLGSCDAIAFGELRSAPTTLEEIWAALPRGLVSALSFAIGADVTAPWVEVRGSDGQLSRRFFCRVGRRLTEDGFPAFSRANEFERDSGIGAFLRAYFALGAEKRDALTVPLNLIRLGAPGWLTVPDSISFLVRALDSICESYGFAKQDLLAELDEGNQNRVNEVLSEAARRLRDLRASSAADGRIQQATVLERIEGRVANAANRDRQFGLALRKLLESLRLHDANVLDRYFLVSEGSGTSWTDRLGKMREEVIHKGCLRIADRRSLRYWFAFALHLHDLCKRIVLREAGYGGFYQASTAQWLGNHSVDRVTPDTEAKGLGFAGPPVPI